MRRTFADELGAPPYDALSAAGPDESAAGLEPITATPVAAGPK